MENAVGEVDRGTRKRGREKYKQQSDKKRTRYSDPDPELLKLQARPCTHNKKSFKCCVVTNADLAKNRATLYQVPDKIAQDRTLTRFIGVCEPQRRRSSGNVARKNTPKKVSTTYYLRTVAHGNVPVCKSFFCYGMNVSKARVLRVAKTVCEGKTPTEKRGGDKKSHKSIAKKTAVREFIKQLKGRESHYGRNKSKRLYLDPALSISNLHKMYQTSVSDESLKVKYPMFYNIFVKEFNIGFSSPAIDACATCMQLKYKLKSAKDNIGKQNLRTELRLHKLSSGTFYALIREYRERDDVLSFCFDLQQVQQLPKTPIQQAYYSRQIGFYSFCCVPLNCKNPTFYTWSEDQAARGSNEIGSALLHYLRNIAFPSGVSNVGMFCDGCAGQNKNNHILHTILYWLRNESPEHIKEAELIFPVRGHSFLPADRTFGRIEKSLRKHSTIVSRDEYNTLYQQVGAVKKLGVDWKIYNLKSLETVYKRLKGISEVKRLKMKKCETRKGTTAIKVKALNYYRFESNEQYVALNKTNAAEETMVIPEVPMKHGLSSEKLRDVQNLLQTHFGVNWRQDQQLQWYLHVFECSQGDEDSEPCDCLSYEKAMHV